MTGNAYPQLAKKKYSPNLKGYIDQCEANYWRLKRLLPYLHAEDERRFGLEAMRLTGIEICDEQLDSSSQELRCYEIRCQVIERCKYTTTLTLIQDTTLADWFPKPTLIVRMYHDAQMAEVLSFKHNRYMQAIYTYPNNKMYQPDEKAQSNAFLGEWLSHCLAFGVSLDEISFATK